jgi:hypothetical protein
MKTDQVRYQDQIFTYTDRSMTLSQSIRAQLIRMLKAWEHTFPREETLIQNRHGVPSLFVRFDFAVSDHDEVRCYEIQDGPAWVGYTGAANARFREIRDAIVSRDWPGLCVVRRETRSDIDDDLWVPRVDAREALAQQYPLIVRNHPEPALMEAQKRELIGRSVRPVYMHNNKRYGADFGWWKVVTWEDSARGEMLPWHSAFVLKPREGFGSADIMLWKPDERAGRATRTQILRTLEERGSMYLQGYIPPMQTEIDGQSYHYIFRPYFIYDANSKGWVPAHGLWTARPAPATRIHGTSDSISGPLYFE